MTFAVKSATALALLLALSACGGDAADDTATPAPTDTAAAPTEAAPSTDSATPAPTDTATPTASPTPAPAATNTAAAPPAVVAEPAAFAQCKACHSVEPGDNGIGPSLAGIFGKKAGTVPGFTYSDAMKSSGLTWNQANLNRFLADPRGVVPDNNMPFAGVKDAAQRQAIVAYLRSL